MAKNLHPAKIQRKKSPPPKASTADIPSRQWLAFATALSLCALVFATYEAAFIGLQPWIIAAKPAVNPDLISPWARSIAYEHDGIETGVALFGTFACLCAAGAIAWFVRDRKTPRWAHFIWLGGAVAAVVIAARTRSSEFGPPASAAWRYGLPVATLAGLWLWHWLHGKASAPLRRAALLLASLALTALVILSLLPANLEDYSYYLGPALKLLQGERLGSFYMQYGLLGTLIFAAMEALGLRMREMQLIMAGELLLWFVLYWYLAKRLLAHAFLRLLFMGALVVVRFLAIYNHPAVVPQVLPMRLDLWVPLLLASERWGLASIKTACAFATVYLADSTFGLLNLAAYLAAAPIALLWTDPGTRSAAPLLRRVAPLFAPAAVATLIQLLVFGSVVSPAASHYLALQLGFLPISPTSLFWPIALMLGWSVIVFVWHRTERASGFALFAALLALVHLTYFFGRSHDHNLLNISGVWLFTVFMALDQAKDVARFRVAVAAVLVTFFLCVGADQAAWKFERVAERLQRGTWLTEHPAERTIEALRPLVGPDVMLFLRGDSYYNYRLGLPQRGYYSPIGANVILDATALWFDDELAAGHRILTIDGNSRQWISDLSSSPGLRQRRRRLVVRPFGPVLEVASESRE